MERFPPTKLSEKTSSDLAGPGKWLFPSSQKPEAHIVDFKKPWQTALRKAGIAYFRLYDLRSTYATRLSAGGAADEWVTQLLRQTDVKVFKKHSQMKREALSKLNRMASETGFSGFDTAKIA